MRRRRRRCASGPDHLLRERRLPGPHFHDARSRSATSRRNGFNDRASSAVVTRRTLGGLRRHPVPRPLRRPAPGPVPVAGGDGPERPHLLGADRDGNAASTTAAMRLRRWRSTTTVGAATSRCTRPRSPRCARWSTTPSSVAGSNANRWRRSGAAANVRRCARRRRYRRHPRPPGRRRYRPGCRHGRRRDVGAAIGANVGRDRGGSRSRHRTSSAATASRARPAPNSGT